MSTSYQDVEHLLSRSGFGGTVAEIESLTGYSWGDLVDRVFETELNPSHQIGLPNLNETRSWSDRYTDMVGFWLNRAATIPRPITEKMVLFWHGHFCSSLKKVNQHQWMFDQNQLFREQGLANFVDLTQAMAIQPAMLKYLDNDKNFVNNPNENFARELMELFMLGVGNYTEADVQAASKAWTGHILIDDDYNFVTSKHDSGIKKFFGLEKNWDGPEIIDYIANGPKSQICAEFITKKLWSFFAYPDPENSVVSTLSQSFISSGMNITALLKEIFLHPNFRSERAKNGLIKSPIEFVITLMIQTGYTSQDLGSQWALEGLGQRPFMPPNVSGWRQNLYWVNSSTVWSRSNLASSVRWKLYHQGELENVRDLSADQAVQSALDIFSLKNVSINTFNALLEYVYLQRNEKPNWPAERQGLLYLPILTPEFWMA